MKVLLVNGSSRANGCTGAALKEVERALSEEGIDTELVFIGNAPLADCTACGSCGKSGKCVFDDLVNPFVEKARAADGFVFGSPVYYAHPSGRLLSFMDRVFYSGDEEGLATMYNIGKNMAWLLRCIALGRENGIDQPKNTTPRTNFIR